MQEYFIEISNPPFPNKGRKIRVFRKWDRDLLSPNLTHLFRVKAEDKQDALALTMSGKAFTMISPSGQQLRLESLEECPLDVA